MNSPLLGIDIGFKRTGVALSESGIIASPLTTLEADLPHMTKVIHGLGDLIKQYGIQTVVVGMPYTEDGEENSQSLKVAAIVQRLRDHLSARGLNPFIEHVNEFYSTVEAASTYPDAQIDAASAALILQEHIDANR